MVDHNKTKTQLIEEVEALRARVAELEQAGAQQRAAEETLHRERDVFARIAETGPVGIVLVNSSEQITFANRQAEQILGLAKDTITQRTYNMPAWRNTDFDGNPLLDEDLPVSRVLKTSAPVYDVRYAVQWPGGQRVLLSVNAAPLFDQENRLNGVVATFEDITAHVQADNALRESEMRYRSFFEDSPMALMEEDGSGVKQIIDRLRATGIEDLRAHFVEHPDILIECISALKLISVNRTSLELFGASSQEELDQGLGTTFGAEALSILREELITFANGQGRFEAETVVHTLAGDKRWIVISSSIMPGYDATWGRVLVSIVDITESRSATQAAQRARQQLQDMFDNAPAAVYAKDMAGRFIFVNEAFRERSGCGDQDVLGRTDCEIYGLSDIWEGPEREVLAANHAITFEEVGRRTQSVYLATKFLLHDENGAPYALCNISIDITKRKRAEEAAQRARRQLQDMFDNAPAVVYAKDMAGRYIFVNQAWRERSGHGDRAVLDRTDCEIFDRTDIWDMNEQEALAAKHAITFEEIGRRTQSVYLATKFLLHSENGAPYALCNISFDITERKRAEEAAQRARQQLIDILHHTPAVVYAKDMQGRFILANQEWAKKTGYSEAQIIGKTGHDLFPKLYGPGDRWFPFEAEVVETGRAVTHEEVGRRSGNSFLATKFLLRDTRGDPYALCNISLDITEHRRAEEAVQRAQQQLQDIFDNTPAVVYVKDLDGRYTFVNQEWRERTGLSTVDAIGKVDQELFPYFDHQKNQQVALDNERILKSGGILYTEEVGKITGTTYLSTKFYLRDVLDNTPYALCSIMIDISDRKQIENEREKLLVQIREQAQQVQHIISTVPEGVILLDAARTVILANPVAENDLEALAGVQVGETLDRLGNRSIEELLTSPPKGLWHEVESDGNRVFEMIARPIETSSAPGGWVMVMRDVTHERMIKQRAQQQERLAAVGQLAAGIAHDFNNIIAVIVLYAQIIRQTTALPPKAQEKLLIIAEQAHRATALIEQVLDFSRRSVLERRPMDLLLFLKEQVKLLERTLPENIAVHLTYEPGDSYVVNADPTRIQQTIMNLVVNARDAMPDGGELRLGLKSCAAESNDALLPDMAPGKWIQLTISDTGTGIAPDALPHVFEPFFTTKAPGQGTGLGLAQVYGIVRQHDGYIDLHSRPGEGTTFTLYFPCGAEDAEAPAFGVETLIQGEGETILVVEDDAATRSALSASLELLNYQVLAARNGQEALALWDGNRAVIALVLSDVVMPQMGGIALFHALKQRDPAVKVMLLTGHMLEQNLEDQLKLLKARGLVDWMQKPPALTKLAETLARILRAGA